MPIDPKIKVLLKRVLTASLALILFITVTSCINNQNKASINEVEDSIFQLVNEIRSAEGLTILDRSPYLDGLARDYVDNQLSSASFQASDIHYLLTNSWEVAYDGLTPSLTEGTAEAQIEYCLDNQSMENAIYRPEARATGIGIAVLGNTIYYTQVFDIVNTSGGNGQPIELAENSEAMNTSWEQIKAFLEQDDTDEIAYEAGLFICGDFAEALHNNAEAAGIKAAYVFVSFMDGPGHALNAFSIEGEVIFVDVINGDKVAYIEAGKSYGVIALDVATEFSYSYFESYAQSVDEYFQEIEDYNSEVEDYESEQPVPEEYNSKAEWGVALNNWHDELEAKAVTLGISDTYWDPTGSLADVADSTVIEFYVHW